MKTFIYKRVKSNNSENLTFEQQKKEFIKIAKQDKNVRIVENEHKQ